MDQNSHFFDTKSLKELQEFLRKRGVVITGQRKADLLDLCKKAHDLNVELDPDGLIEDREEIIREKLQMPSGFILDNPFFVKEVTNNLAILPVIGIVDIYNYLLQCTDYTHNSLREYHKLEGYGMFQDGHVMDMLSHKYKDGYTVVLSKVKPRTKEKDPITKLSYYRCWIIFSISMLQGCIQSAFCTCKGGIDGYCRHVVATLFELMEYTQDAQKKSVTSAPCIWVKRQKIAENPVLATDLETSITSETSKALPICETYNPITDDTDMPSTASFFEIIKETYPSACIMDVWEVRNETKQPEIKKIQGPAVVTPTEKIFTLCNEMWTSSDVVSLLQYTKEELTQIEVETRGQRENPQWHEMRKGLLTASNFKDICVSQNLINTALRLLQTNSMDEDKLPEHVQFGINYESKARNIFLSTHRYRHKLGSKCLVPGLIIHSEIPYLGASCDGILECKMCGKHLIEIKCLSSKRNFHPKTALTMLKICEITSAGQLELLKNHKYFYQMQGQMLVTGITSSYFVAYTHKGIHSIQVSFDEQFCKSMEKNLSHFYKNVFIGNFVEHLKKSLDM